MRTRLTRLLTRMTEPLLRPLEWIGLRRRILYLNNSHWDGVSWPRVFADTGALRLRFRVIAVRFDQLLADSDDSLPAIDQENYRTLAIDGLRLWELTWAGILASLEAPVIDRWDERVQRVVAHYYRIATRAVRGSGTWIERVRPHTILVTQGCTPMARPLIEVGRQRGLTLVATEGSFLGDYIYCDNATGMIVNRHRGATLDPAWLDARAFDPGTRAAFRRRYDSAVRSKRPEHRTDAPAPAIADVRAALGIAPDTRIALFLGQVLTDASIIMDSPVFADPAALILQLQQIISRHPGWCLVIRLHPKEATGCSWANAPRAGYGYAPGEPCGPLDYNHATFRRLLDRGFGEKPGQCVCVHGTDHNTAQLMAAADMGITLTSQAGLEMVLANRPVVVCGNAFYKRQGFTWDVDHPAALAPVVEAAMDASLTEQQLARAEQYTAHLLDTVLLPRDVGRCSARLTRIMRGCT